MTNSTWNLTWMNCTSPSSFSISHEISIPLAQRPAYLFLSSLCLLLPVPKTAVFIPERQALAESFFWPWLSPLFLTVDNKHHLPASARDLVLLNTNHASRASAITAALPAALWDSYLFHFTNEETASWNWRNAPKDTDSVLVGSITGSLNPIIFHWAMLASGPLDTSQVMWQKGKNLLLQAQRIWQNVIHWAEKGLDRVHQLVSWW